MQFFSITKVRVRPFLRKNKTNSAGEAPLYCKIRINKVKTKADLSADLMIPIRFWSSKTQNVLPNYERSTYLNTKIMLMKTRIEQIEMQMSLQGLNPDAEMVKAEYMRLYKQKAPIQPKRPKKVLPKEEPKFSLQNAIDEFIEHQKQSGKSVQTIKNYKTMGKNVIETLLGLGKTLFVDEIKPIHTAQLDNAMMAKKYVTEHRSRHILFLKNVMEFATVNERCVANTIGNVKVNFSTTYNTDCLQESQIRRLETRFYDNYFEDELDRKTVAIWLFLSGTGLDWCDLLEMSTYDIRFEENAQCYVIEHKRAKYKTKGDKAPIAYAVLTDWATRIIENYGFCLASFWKENEILQQDFNERIKPISKGVGVCIKKVSSKVARKSYANYWQNKRTISDESMAAMMGHTNTKKLVHYRKIKLERILTELTNHNPAQAV